MVTDQEKLEIANKVVESLNDIIIEEIDHYMFVSGKYDETDNAYIVDREYILKLITKKLLK